jgi:hypothetical protein
MPSTRYAIYRGDAKRRGLPFELTRDDFDALWGKPCTYCGAAIEGIGLDRVDSEAGYVASNVVPCCWICNTWKSHMTLEEFRRHAQRVYRVVVQGLAPEDATPTLPARRKNRIPVNQPYSPVVVRRPPGRPKGSVSRAGSTERRGRLPQWSSGQYEDAIDQAQGHIGRAALLLGCNRRTLERYLARTPKLRQKIAAFRSGEALLESPVSST